MISKGTYITNSVNYVMFAWARGLSNIYAHEHLASKLSVVYMLYT